jgi:hypothetical protein
VSSYGRNAFTRGHPCLCPVRSPLYTWAVATCPGSSHLRRRRSDPGPGASRLLRCLARAATGPGRDVLGRRASFLVLLGIRHRSTAIRTFGTEGAPPQGIIPAQRNSYGISGISVLLAPVQRRVFPRDRSRTQTEGRQRGRARAMLPKTNFPNMSDLQQRSAGAPPRARKHMQMRCKA